MNVAWRAKRVRFTNFVHNQEAALYLWVLTSTPPLQMPVQVHLVNNTLHGYQVFLLPHSIDKSFLTIIYQLLFSDGHYVLHLAAAKTYTAHHQLIFLRRITFLVNQRHFFHFNSIFRLHISHLHLCIIQSINQFIQILNPCE